MTNSIIIFLVDVIERAEVSQLAAAGLGAVLLAHEHPQALHAALCACLHLDGKDVHVLNGEVVDFGDALAYLKCSTEQEWLMNVALLPFKKRSVDTTADIILHNYSNS